MLRARRAALRRAYRGVNPSEACVFYGAPSSSSLLFSFSFSRIRAFVLSSKKCVRSRRTAVNGERRALLDLTQETLRLMSAAFLIKRRLIIINR